jgi:hypothetical protein
MKMIVISLIFSLFCSVLTAPPNNSIVIFESEPIQVFDKMLYAFQKVESNFDTDTINRLGYGGILQIGQEMINEANRICRIRQINESFALSDRLDSIKSVRVWYIVQNYWNESYTLKKACMVWNPLASVNYFNKIKKLM